MLVDFLLLLIFYRDYRVVGRVRVFFFFFELKHSINGVGGLKSRKSGIWGQNDVILAFLGPKWRSFWSTRGFFFLNSRYNLK